MSCVKLLHERIILVVWLVDLCVLLTFLKSCGIGFNMSSLFINLYYLYRVLLFVQPLLITSLIQMGLTYTGGTHFYYRGSQQSGQ